MCHIVLKCDIAPDPIIRKKKNNPRINYFFNRLKYRACDHTYKMGIIVRKLKLSQKQKWDMNCCYAIHTLRSLYHAAKQS